MGLAPQYIVVRLAINTNYSSINSSERTRSAPPQSSPRLGGLEPRPEFYAEKLHNLTGCQ